VKTTKKAALTLDEARSTVLQKVRAAGAKGAGSPVTAATREPRRSLLEQALRELESERVLFADRTAKKSKFFLAEFAPDVRTVAVKIDQFAARKHPELMTSTQLKKALARIESPLFIDAFATLETERRLLKLVRGKQTVYAHGESLRAMLGGLAPRIEAAPAVPTESILRAYRELVRRTGFPDVEIAALQRESGLAMDRFKQWLLREHGAGRAVFSLGDWSLADEHVRAGVVELGGDRYLLARLEE